MYPAHPELIINQQAGVLTLAINRPQYKNALHAELYLTIVDALDRADKDHQVRVVVLRGADGDFTAGNDMQDFMRWFNDDLTMCKAGDLPPFQLFKAVARFTKPILIAVKGVAIGIGTTLLLHVDMAFADDSAVFQMPFVSLGLTTEGAASKLIVDKIGYAQTAELLFTAKKFNCNEAERLGLVNIWHTDKSTNIDVYDHTQAVAEQIARLPIRAIKTTKALMKKNLTDIVAYIDDEAQVFIERVKSDECKEAVNAFIQKRKPDFSKFV